MGWSFKDEALKAVIAAGAVLVWTGLIHAQSIEALLAAKAQRTPAQRKLSSQFLDATGSAQPPAVAPGPDTGGTGGVRADVAPAVPASPRAVPVTDEQAPSPAVEAEVVTVDIRADVTPAVLERIRALGGTVLSSVPKYRAIRARLPRSALEALAALEAVQFISPAEQPITHQVLARAAVNQAVVATRKVTTTEGDVAHQANVARQTHSVDGTGISIGVLSDGVDGIAAQQATGDVPAQVTVLPSQAGGSFGPICGKEYQGAGSEGTAMFEIVHDLAPGAELFFATGGGGQAQMAQNIEDLCTSGADVIVDDIGYLLAPAFQDGVIAQAISSVVAKGCSYFSAAGNGGNLNDTTSGVWEGNYVEGPDVTVNGVLIGKAHDFGGGVIGNRIEKSSFLPTVLQWADPIGGSANDYDLFLIDADNNVLASSTNTQDGTQDPIEYIDGSCANDRDGTRLAIIKNAGAADRYLRLNYVRGGFAITTAGRTFGHAASQDAIGVAAVDARAGGGAGGVFDGTESVETFSSDGPRRLFFEADGTPITAGNFSSSGGRVLNKPDLTAADGVSTSTPGFADFHGTSAAAPHAAGIAALVLEAAGGPAHVTPTQLRTAMTGSALDIEAMGVDRDSGAGIVMAPGAVDAVDVAVADRNGAPTVASTLTVGTLSAGADVVTLSVANTFADPDSDPLTYSVLSSNPNAVTASMSGSALILLPLAPGRVPVTVRATDPDGLTATQIFSVTVTAPPGSGGGGASGDRHGNTPAQATHVQPDSSAPWTSFTVGQIDPADDIDYFQFTLPQAGVLVVETTGLTDTVGTVWQDGEVVASADTGGGRQNFRLSVRVQAGVVVVAVGGNGNRTGDYALETRLLVGYLENPGVNSFQSGVGVLSGWVCEAKEVEVTIGDLAPQLTSYGTERADTAYTEEGEALCRDTDNGFGLLFNWNRLGDGDHEVIAWVDGVELDRATVTVTTLPVDPEDKEFVTGVAGKCTVEDFPMAGESVRLVWQQSQQNFVLAEGPPLIGIPPTPSDVLTGFLENPSPYSFQSGIGVISGWVCEAEEVEITLGDLPPQLAVYGTERTDTVYTAAGEVLCGDTDNGFGLLFNWNRLGEGEHTVIARVDGEELGRTQVRVTTLGLADAAGEEIAFVQGIVGTCTATDFPMEGQSVTLEWQQNSQNFVITGVE